MGSAQLSLLEICSGSGDLNEDSLFGPSPIPDHFSPGSKREARALLNELWACCIESMKETVEELWFQKRRHYTSERILIRNISKRAMVDESMIAVWRQEMGWPGVSDVNSVLPRTTAWRSVDYVNDNDDLVDPLGLFIDSVYRTPKQKILWGRYCRVNGVLLPENIHASDIKTVLQAPISQKAFYKLFQQEPYSFGRYMDYLGLDLRTLSRRQATIPLNRLIMRNNRLRPIAIAYAQMLYTHRGIPISEIALKLGIDPVTLWSMGDKQAQWRLPNQATLNHLINESVLRSFV